MINIIRTEINKALALLSYFAIAEITKIDYKNQLAKAKILTSNMKTNWLRIASDYVGDSFGEVKPLNIGDEVLVCFPDGNPASQGVILRRLFGKDIPPDQTEDQYHYKHKSGTDILIKKDGSIEGKIVKKADLFIEDTANITVKKDITIYSDKKVIIEGTPVIELNGRDDNAVLYSKLEQQINTWIQLLNAHFHIGNMGAPTSPPQPPIQPPQLTPAKSNKVKLA